MNKKPVLVIMAAGMGSRYGGLKQMDPIDEYGNLIIDFSIFDAIEAGFETVVFIIKKAMEADFKECIGDRISKFVKTEYVYQELDTLPQGFVKPADRKKPWGTAHAIMCCKSVIDAPFAVINADDYYGKSAFKAIYKELLTAQDDDVYHYTMVGFDLYNTLTEHGHVARGVCRVDNNQMLTEIKERTRIEKHGETAEYTEDGGVSWIPMEKGTVVSMNMWGFTKGIIGETEARFTDFLEKQLPDNPLTCEYFLPSVVGELLLEKKAMVKVLHSPDCWYGVTYKEDKEKVVVAIKSMKERGLYPEQLWKEGSR